MYVRAAHLISVSERCSFDFVFVVEHSLKLAIFNWGNIYQFIVNLVTNIDARIKLGDEARFAVITYSANTTSLTTLTNAYDLEKLMYVMTPLQSNANSDSASDGLKSALEVATRELQPSIARRLVDWTTRKQALILLKFGDVNDTMAAEAKRILYTLMNTLVHVTVIGKSGPNTVPYMIN